jgi:hypothetical protein
MILNVSPRDSAGTRGTFFSTEGRGRTTAFRGEAIQRPRLDLHIIARLGVAGKAATGSETAAAATRIGIRVLQSS